ncbi:hypothetical protein ASG76_05455 [Nocardioides sp. Soil774]|uniref:Ig-like domain-containing protein n=1 Tax=Nocardioides sp. Soil774 TaxID=1736408 RepID=UPI0006F6AE94|nr:Ig-like domain-containing protein [Nocardioides sp. Soil774]KRE95131.1 hypothetical protein ASG76_05455 [Nocardioides sp. Soil774]
MSSARSASLLVAGVLGLVPTGGGAAYAVPATANATTTTTVVSLSTVQSVYGQAVTATASVTSSAGAPNGDVYFAVDNLNIKANLLGNGTASVVLPRLHVGSHPVVATFVQYPDPTVTSTSAPVDWVVQQVRTRVAVQVTGRRTTGPTAVRAQVDGEYGTRPSGRVRVVLHRTGTRRTVRVVVPVDATGLAVAPFGRLRRGAYRAVVTYTGDPDHLRQRRVERFRVSGT